MNKAQSDPHVGGVLIVGDVVQVAEGERGPAGDIPMEPKIVLKAGTVEFLAGLGMEVAALPVELEKRAYVGSSPVFPGDMSTESIPEVALWEITEGRIAIWPADIPATEVENVVAEGAPFSSE